MVPYKWDSPLISTQTGCLFNVLFCWTRQPLEVSDDGAVWRSRPAEALTIAHLFSFLTSPDLRDCLTPVTREKGRPSPAVYTSCFLFPTLFEKREVTDHMWGATQVPVSPRLNVPFMLECRSAKFFKKKRRRGGGLEATDVVSGETKTQADGVSLRSSGGAQTLQSSFVPSFLHDFPPSWLLEHSSSFIGCHRARCRPKEARSALIVQLRSEVDLWQEFKTSPSKGLFFWVSAEFTDQLTTLRHLLWWPGWRAKIWAGHWGCKKGPKCSASEE